MMYINSYQYSRCLMFQPYRQISTWAIHRTRRTWSDAPAAVQPAQPAQPDVGPPQLDLSDGASKPPMLGTGPRWLCKPRKGWLKG